MIVVVATMHPAAVDVLAGEIARSNSVDQPEINVNLVCCHILIGVKRVLNVLRVSGFGDSHFAVFAVELQREHRAILQTKIARFIGQRIDLTTMPQLI